MFFLWNRWTESNEINFGITGFFSSVFYLDILTYTVISNLLGNFFSLVFSTYLKTWWLSKKTWWLHIVKDYYLVINLLLIMLLAVANDSSKIDIERHLLGIERHLFTNRQLPIGLVFMYTTLFIRKDTSITFHSQFFIHAGGLRRFML